MNLKDTSSIPPFKIPRLMVLFLLFLTACNDLDDFSIPELEGLSLYWDYEVFGEEGRRFRFSFSAS